MKNILTIAAIITVFTLSVFSSADAAENTYRFKIFNEKNKAIVEGSFKGEDTNGDGWIDKSELIRFSEKVNQTCLSGKIQKKGWKKFVNEKEYPIIIHELQDVKKFRFGVNEWRKGIILLEFETNTNEMKNFSVKGYLFWRKTELKENGKKVVFLNGVSDGKEGLVFCMSEAKKLRIDLRLSNQ